MSSIPCIVLLLLIFTALSFGRDDTAGSLVPALSSQPFFQRLETDFRVIAPQLRDVRPETIGVEPVEHLVEFLAENQPDHRHGQLLEPDRFSEDTAENLVEATFREARSHRKAYAVKKDTVSRTLRLPASS